MVNMRIFPYRWRVGVYKAIQLALPFKKKQDSLIHKQVNNTYWVSGEQATRSHDVLVGQERRHSLCQIWRSFTWEEIVFSHLISYRDAAALQKCQYALIVQSSFLVGININKQRSILLLLLGTTCSRQYLHLVRCS